MDRTMYGKVDPGARQPFRCMVREKGILPGCKFITFLQIFNGAQIFRIIERSILLFDRKNILKALNKKDTIKNIYFTCKTSIYVYRGGH